MTITLATPDEHVKIIAIYMRPSPQSNPTVRAKWSQLTDYAVSLGIKKHHRVDHGRPQRLPQHEAYEALQSQI
jgi:hypothetical protein